LHADLEIIVILWTQRGRELTLDDLCHIIRGFAQGKSVMVNKTTMRDLRLGHRKHTVPKEEIANGIGFLDRIFETKTSRP